MTIEKAIELLQIEIHDHQLFLNEYTGNYLNAPELKWIELDMLCIEALEKQIKMSPKLVFTDTYRCPSCGEFLTDINCKKFVQEDLRFCPLCGQRLDWGEEK